MPATKPAAKPDPWTKDRFLAWLAESKADLHVNPYDVVACLCGDVNCHGWRLVRPEPIEPES